MLRAVNGPSDAPASPPQTRVRPLVDELVCDAETPVGVYARLRGLDRPCFMLESVVGQQQWARYSFVGVGFRARVVGQWDASVGDIVVDIEAGEGFEVPAALKAAVRAARGLAAVQRVLDHYRAPVGGGADLGHELPRFWGGLVGVFGHELVRGLEHLPRPDHHREATGLASELPAFELWVSDAMVIFDNLSQRVQVVCAMVPDDDGGEVAAEAAARTRVDQILARLRHPERPALPAIDLGRCEAAGARAEAHVDPAALAVRYPAQVDRAKEFIFSGDVFQLVLSQPFVEPRAVEGRALDALSVYRTLRFTNPAPYMYLLELNSATLVGASPEVLVRVDRDTRRVTVRPIAGTRRRGKDQAEDLALERELLADPKERAEHLMLIDLGRNDVGRVSVAGSVEVPEQFVIERYSRVMHIVSEVWGTLRPELSVLDALRATFPAGTLSGAPKVRALQLIDELEAVPRGWYGGAVGYLGFDGGADFAICIRSVVMDEAQLRVQAGAGLVYDSEPVAEDEECHKKASAVVRAIAMARAIDTNEAST